MNQKKQQFRSETAAKSLVFLTEDTTPAGVIRVAGKVADDVEKVTGFRPPVEGDSHRAEKELFPDCGSRNGTGRKESDSQGEEPLCHGESERKTVVLAATLEHSPLADQLVQSGRISEEQIKGIRGKREVYLRAFLAASEVSDEDSGESENSLKQLQEKDCESERDPFSGQDVIFILGSDKRGTIYGLFSLSEYIGVTPLTFWGDAPVLHRDTLEFGPEFDMISQEPSVEYRGFFINDEWPAFGNWCMEHFGGFHASLYDCVFEFLLRMKGNYLWPAMWTSSFPLDGPGPADMELADEYGVIWSFSHHEPCLRASEEWDKVRGEHSVYGNDWDFRCNREGLLRYWEDALKERGRYENMITIGMRGERDSALLGEDSPVEDNVALLKEIISAQRSLIGKLEQQGLVREHAPQMLAVYKEVEEYYYGNDRMEGLYRWEGLDGVICMLSDDNFGHLRTLPTKEMRSHDGGYGMYYHLDYHGGPVSYEWIDSTPFSQIWEEMCEAWDYGVRRLWIVNVGDVKFHELPLQYFMDLAYDFDRFGTKGSVSCSEYVRQLIRRNFPNELAGMSPELADRMEEVFNGFLFLSQLRRPESLHAGIYHASHEKESRRMLDLTDRLEEKNRSILQTLREKGGEEQAAFTGYYSMIGWQTAAFCNLLRMYLCEGINHRLAAQGRPFANVWAQKVRDCLARDRRLSSEWAQLLGGKWSGMELAHHIGFTQWNDFGRKMPVTMELSPAEDPILCVSRADEDEVAVRVYGQREKIFVPDFRYRENTEVLLELSNNGTGELTASFQRLPAWLLAECDRTVLGTGELVTARLLLLRDRMPEGEDELSAVIEIAGSDETTVEVVVTARNKDNALPGRGKTGVLVLEAENAENAPEAAESAQEKAKQDSAQTVSDAEESGCTPCWKAIPFYGKHGFGQKVYPDTESFAAGDPKAPALFWDLEVGEEDDYVIRMDAAPSNPLEFVRPLTLGVRAEKKDGGIPEEEVQEREVTLAAASRTIGSCSNGEWSKAVLDQERTAETVLHLEKGSWRLSLLAREAGVIVERVLLYHRDFPPADSYLGPEKPAPYFFA